MKVFDCQKDASLRYAEEMGVELNINIRPVETIEDATEADIVITTTPSRQPVVKRQHIRAGTHINAIGADAKGKQELDAEVLKEAIIVIDNIAQASRSGEINVPLSNGLITVDDIYGTLGEVVTNIKKGARAR